MNEQKKKDAIDVRVRLVSGALLGIVVGALGGLLIFGRSNEALLITIALAFTFAFIATRWDRRSGR